MIFLSLKKASILQPFKLHGKITLKQRRFSDHRNYVRRNYVEN